MYFLAQGDAAPESLLKLILQATGVTGLLATGLWLLLNGKWINLAREKTDLKEYYEKLLASQKEHYEERIREKNELLLEEIEEKKEWKQAALRSTDLADRASANTTRTVQTNQELLSLAKAAIQSPPSGQSPER